MNVEVDATPFLQTLALIASTFASEDMTCVAAGILARVGKLHLTTAMIGCFLGIYLGDIGLWLIGRIMGRRVLEWNWCARKLPRPHRFVRPLVRSPWLARSSGQQIHAGHARARLCGRRHRW
ncbi:MAG: hypothetical protein IPK83_04980 [Planctomycetes bacterium]|nr:hypothetical protein [Planctomycetota bacterium]